MKVYFPFKFVSFLICSFKLFLGIFTSMIAMSSWRVCGFIIMKSSLSLLILFILKFTLFDSESHSYPFMLFARHIWPYPFISICPPTLLYFKNTSYRKCTVKSYIFIYSKESLNFVGFFSQFTWLQLLKSLILSINLLFMLPDFPALFCLSCLILS